MTAILKSIAFALLGTALFFCFFMMFSIAASNVMARLHNPNTPLQAPDVVLAPAAWLRMPGLPLSAVAFVVCFILAMKKFRKSGFAAVRHQFAAAGEWFMTSATVLKAGFRVALVTALFTMLGFALGGLAGIIGISIMRAASLPINLQNAIWFGAVPGGVLGWMAGAVIMGVLERRNSGRLAEPTRGRPSTSSGQAVCHTENSGRP